MASSEEYGTHFLYRYEPLDRTRGKIRLLRFLAWPLNTHLQTSRGVYSSAESIQCALETYELDQLTPYVALSYTWGHTRPSKTILVNGKVMQIGQNLHEVLCVLQQKDHVHFSEDPAREGDLIQHYFWIDAICVNQRDYDERGHQVNLMAHIFSEARCVIAWLGPRSDNSCLGTHIIRTGETRSGPNVEGLSNSYDQRQAKIWQEEQASVVDLLSRPYWDRMWVVQEFLLPRNLMILCGDHGIWWESMERNFLSKSAKDLALIWNGRSVVTDHRMTGWWNLNEARRRWQASTNHMTTESRTLDQLLRQFHRGECSDVRDRVYALLSLVQPPATVATSAMLSADYNIPARRLYYRVLGQLRHFSSLTNFLEWADFRLLLSQALKIPHDDEFQLYESFYQITDVLQDRKLLQLGLAEYGGFSGTKLSPQSRLREQLRRQRSRESPKFPWDEDPDAWRFFEEAKDLITSCLTQTTETFRSAAEVIGVLKKEGMRLRQASQNSSGESGADFIHTVRAMLEPEEDWLVFG